MNSLDYIDSIFKGDLYHVYCYYGANLSDDEINDFEDQLEDCCCTVW